MPDPKEEALPEGTDQIVAGASSENEEALIVREPTARDIALDKIKSGTGKLSDQAADKVFSWSNARVLRALPERLNDGRGALS